MREEQWPSREFARHNRSHMSKAEAKLWIFLRRRALGHRFRRQHAIGRYIVDFVCLEKRLIVEVDGRQHGDLDNDRVRDDHMRRRGYRVLRFSAWSSLEYTNEVVDEIRSALRGDESPDKHPDEILERHRRGF